MAIPPKSPQDINQNNLYQYQRHLKLIQSELEKELNDIDEFIKFSKTNEGRKLDVAVFQPNRYLADAWKSAEIYWQRLFAFSQVELWKKRD